MRELESSLQQFGEFLLKAQLVRPVAAPYLVRYVRRFLTRPASDELADQVRCFCEELERSGVASVRAHAEAFLCHAPIAERRGHPADPGIPRARARRDDDDRGTLRLLRPTRIPLQSMRLSQTLAHQVSAKTRARGAAYHASGAVTNLVATDGVIQATVVGNDAYAVLIDTCGLAT